MSRQLKLLSSFIHVVLILDQGFRNNPALILIHRILKLSLPHLDTQFVNEVEAQLSELLGIIQRTAIVEVCQ